MEMEKSDRDFILEGKYPYFPFLPVKRYKDGQRMPEVGFIFYGEFNKVYLMNLFRFWEEKEVTLESLPTVRYDTVDELLADGWVVD